ncbi:MAG: hypothetical protein H7239_11980 [Flavobacterium sp.]|nr:hypothetical protein [Flavobacterium sp.]
MYRQNKSKRLIATFFLVIFFPTMVPTNLFASNNGPKAPEAASFEPVDATDMVNLATGDMSYVLPLLNVPSPEGGYPINLAYHGGIAYDSEASWIGLGWNLNPGAIERDVNGNPDDWKEALVRTRNFYKYESESVSLGVSIGMEGASIDVGVTYGWDSNGTKYGTVNIGAGVGEKGESSVGGGYSIGYSNKSGLLFDVYVGYRDKSGIGVGASAGTSGATVGASYQLSMGKLGSGKSETSVNSTIGISLSSAGGISGGYSISAGTGNSGFSVNQGGLGETTIENMGLAIPVFPAVWITFGKRLVKYEKDETYANFITGPLYFSTFNNAAGTDSTYSNEMGNEVNRQYFMDVNEQRLPESEIDLIAYKNVYEKQKCDFTFPNYDNYIVNAQGLSGSMLPRLLENGTLVGKPENFELTTTKRVWGGAISTFGILVPLPGQPNLQNLIDPSDAFMHLGIPALYYTYNKETYIKNWNNNVSNNNVTLRKFTNTFGATNSYTQENNSNKINFYFENSFPSNLIINPSTINTLSTGSDITNYIGNSNNEKDTRQRSSNYIETYTNAQIVNVNGNTNILEAINGDDVYNRSNEEGYAPDGIGAYKITTPDGKTYHYSLPVYQFEEIYRQKKQNPDSQDYFPENETYHEQRKIQAYATHWVLTAVTGPDFYDVNQNHIADQGDYGYWTRFDYGKWTDGYTWRAPYDGFNDFNQVASYLKPNAQEYAWGRKQLVYLNKVVTRTHTAYFVKSLRKDSMSKQIGTGNGGYPSYEGDANILYPMQRSLKLDEIILVKNEFANVNANTQLQNLISNPNDEITVSWHSPIVKNYNPQNVNINLPQNAYALANNKIIYGINRQHLMIDKEDFETDANGKYTIYANAVKIIKLNQDYSLATHSPHSDAPAIGNTLEKGRLTLNQIKVLGRNAYDYMPPTNFEYNNKELAYSAPTITSPGKDPWGYNATSTKAWSLNKITMPTGSSIEFELEKDTYWTEAVGRRYWTEDLKFKPFVQNGNEFVEVTYKAPATTNNYSFSDYFIPNERVYLDLWIGRKNKYIKLSSSFPYQPQIKTDTNNVNVLGSSSCNVFSVSNTNVVIQIPSGSIADGDNGNNRIIDGEFARGDDPIIGSNVYYPTERGEYPPIDEIPVAGNPNHHSMYYAILANRIPGEGTGGGIRVKSITAVDENKQRFTTEYSYNDPILNRSSGITSFAPVRGLKFVPYQSEMPAPRVMYEYVTVREKQSNSGTTQYNGKTVYKFNVLNNVYDIFTKNLKVGEYFRSTVASNDNLNANKKLKSADIKIEDNTSALGSIESISHYNNYDQLISKSITKRRTLDELKAGVETNNIKGAVQESFQSLKSIYKHTSNYVIAEVGLSAIFVNYTSTQRAIYGSSKETKNRFLNVSTKMTYPSSVAYTEELDATGVMHRTEMLDQDSNNALFNTKLTKKSDGKYIKSSITPAYNFYPEMGNKCDDINNKHMLTQEAMSITSVLDYGAWRSITGNITTWNKNWIYRDNLGDEDKNSPDVWRKHKTFVLNQPLSIATAATFVNADVNFDWSTGTPNTDELQWKKTSEITRYNHYSSPIETKDINNNFASSKMADNNSKVIVAGNARYTEMYYSGAEYIDHGNYFEGEVQGADFVSSDVAHTGDFSVKAINADNKVFKVNGKSGSNNYYQNPDAYTEAFRPGKYKLSVWVLEKDVIDESKTKKLPIYHSNGTILELNGEAINVSEIVYSGCWKQLNYYLDIPVDGDINIELRNFNSAETNPVYFDDFRLHPIASSVNSFVYDHKTDELSYSLDANNMGTAFKYDNAGRLKATYIETENHTDLFGGFKITSQMKQKYKSSNETSQNEPAVINNCLASSNGKMEIAIRNECIATFENKFRTNVSGGSGNYSYQYKWLINDTTGQFSEWIDGDQIQYIPYAAKMCLYGGFDKNWSFIVRVKDNNTGEEKEKNYSYSTQGCSFNLKKWADLQITRCNERCGRNNYSFKIHLKDISKTGEFRYEYAHYNSSLNQYEQDYIDVTDKNGEFCPNWGLVPDANCPTHYRRNVKLIYRITNPATGEIQYGFCEFMGECSIPEDESRTINTLSDVGQKYLQEGNVIYTNEKGDVERIENVNKVVK